MPHVSVTTIKPGRFQPRQVFDQEKMLELAQSLDQHGQFTPVSVFIVGSKFELIAGERRWRAVCANALANRGELNMKLPEAVEIVCRPDWPDRVQEYFFLNTCQIRAEVDDNPDLDHIREVSVLENIKREDLSPVEIARALVDLRGNGGSPLPIRKLAERVGKSKSWVEDYLKIADLPDAVAAMMTADNGAAPLDFSVARELARRLPVEFQEPLAAELQRLADKGAVAGDLKKIVSEIAKFIDPNRWSLTGNDQRYQPMVYNRARLINHLLATTPSEQLVRALIPLRGSSQYDSNYLTKKVDTVLDSNWDFTKIISAIDPSARDSAWEKYAPAQGWVCDNCILAPIVDGIDERVKGYDVAPCCAKLQRSETTTCEDFVGLDDPPVIQLNWRIRDDLVEADHPEIKSNLIGNGPRVYVETWQEYIHLYAQARIAKTNKEQDKATQNKTAHLPEMQAYWDAQQNQTLLDSGLDLDHLYAHACHKCAWHTPIEAAGGNIPCHFAKTPLKDDWDYSKFRAPYYGFWQGERAGGKIVTLPRCEMFRYREMPEIKPQTTGYVIPFPEFVLSMFRSVTANGLNRGSRNQYLWQPLDWLPEMGDKKKFDLLKLWERVANDDIMIELLTLGLWEFRAKDWNSEVKIWDPETSQLVKWIAVEFNEIIKETNNE